MTDTPRFSVAIPAYNAAATLSETLDSVLAQSFDDFEVVICDDGSTDDTLAVAQAHAARDSRIRVVSQENRGSGGAYNAAVRETRADLVVMLSADDLLVPEHLEAMAAHIASHPEAAIFTCDGFYEYPGGAREPVGANASWASPATCTLPELLRACFYGVGAVFRREVFDAVGGFREDIYAEDYSFWLTALAKGFSHTHLDRPLSVHRRNAEQKSADALRTRETDVRVIEDLIAAGLFSGEALEAAHASVSRLRRNIRIRKTLGAVMGPKRAEALIGALRGRR